MLRRIGTHMKLGIRFLVVIAVAMGVMGAGTLFAAYQFREAMLQSRYQQARATVEAAMSIAAANRAEAAQGRISEADAKARTLAAIGAMRFDGGNYVFVFDPDGVAVSWGPFADRVGKSQIDVKDHAGKPYVRALIARAKAGGGFETYLMAKPSGDGELEKTSFVVMDPAWNWVVGSGVLTADVDWTVVWTLGVIALACVPALFGFLGLAWWLSAGVTRPLAAVEAAIARLSRGETTIAIPGTERGDEVGVVAKAVEVFRQSLIERDELKSEELRHTEQRRHQAEAVQVAVARFRTEADDVLGFLRSASDDMAKTASELTQVANQNRASADAAEDQATRDSSHVSAVASATEELSTTVAEVGEQIAQASRTTAEGAELGRRAHQSVGALAQSAERIGAIVDLIREIADQTNLLALNATIEAARAGIAGRGFAVVASEVKALAAQTTRATEEIATNVGAIQGATREAVAQIVTVTETLGRIEEASTAIAAAVREQAVTTLEISGRATDVARGTAELSSAIGEVSSSAAETTLVATRVSEVAGSLREAAQRLDGRIRDFLNDVAA